MKILLRHGKKEDWKMVDSAAYENEAELQKLLADSPSLISLEDVRSGSGILVAAVRELPLSIGPVDLVAFSAQGDMVITECKLADNSEIKRTVIGQVLEYGAHIWHMEYDELDQKVIERSGQSLADLVRKSAGDSDWDEEAFRNNVESSLAKGNFILMIVVDEINDDLSRIIRFVNACGNPAFSFAALEMRRFQSGDAEMLVPRIVGDSRTVSSGTASSVVRKRWTKELFFQDASERLDPLDVAILQNLFDWSGKYASTVRMGTGADLGSFTFLYERNGVLGSVFSVYSNGNMQINFGYMENIFSPEEIRAFREILATIPTLGAVRDSSKYYYTINIAETFNSPENIQAFKLEVLKLKDFFK